MRVAQSPSSEVKKGKKACVNTAEQEHGTGVGTESISLTRRRQSTEHIIGNTHPSVNDDRARLQMGLWKWRRGFYFKSKPIFTHTHIYPHTHNQKKSICPSSRHQGMCVQGLLRIPRSDTERKAHGSAVLILAPSMAGDHSLLSRWAF